MTAHPDDTGTHDGIELDDIAIGVIGSGRLAWSLVPALARAGYRVTAVGARDIESAAALANAASPDTYATDDAAEVLARATLIFLAVRDDAIAPLAAGLPWTPRHFAVHCSGALGLDALATASKAGAVAGCMHPLQSFPSRRAEPDRFRGIACGIEAAEPLGSLLTGITERAGAHPFRLEGIDRALYHAAAVFASNNAIAVMSAACRTWALAGLPPERAREALAPLFAAVADNVRALALEEALTGPVARGDTATIAAHLRALSSSPDLARLYRVLGLELLNLAAGLDGDARRAVEQELRGPGRPDSA